MVEALRILEGASGPSFVCRWSGLQFGSQSPIAYAPIYWPPFTSITCPVTKPERLRLAR